MTIQNFGRHRVRHGDVNDWNGFDAMMAGDKADLMYSDPPWGEGNIKYWATMNKKMTGQVVQPTPLDQFLSSIFRHAGKYVTRFLLVEYGQQWADMIQDRGRKAGFQPHGIIKIRYRGGGTVLPLDLHLFARPGETYPPGYADKVKGSMGYEGVRLAFDPIATICKLQNPKAIALDPCCGMGYTAQASIDNGISFRGNELNAKRLGKTIGRLERSMGKAA